MPNVYLILFDLQSLQTRYIALDRWLETIGAVELRYEVHLLKSENTAFDVERNLRRYMDRDDKASVFKLADDYAAPPDVVLKMMARWLPRGE